MTMIELRYRMNFTTPAFLGNAEQAGQWRAPPIKALLRQWWRVVYANDFPSASMTGLRDAEGRLFGHAWLDSDRDEQGQTVSARRSRIRLRLSKWDHGTLPSARWNSLATVPHPEVRQPVAADLYLGYGPVILPRGQRAPTLKSSAAIQAGEGALLSIALPAEEAPRIVRVLALADRFGTVGGRSRNGWGSVSLVAEGSSPPLSEASPELPTLAWMDAIGFEWPQAIGTDQRGPLVWQGNAETDWKPVMRRLAEIKVSLRTQFRFPHERPDGQVHARHWLSYPITSHKALAWDRSGLRLPNSLRFKVRAEADGRLRGVVFHMPCLPPPAFRPDRNAIEGVWRKVHAHLDADTRLTRAPT